MQFVFLSQGLLFPPDAVPRVKTWNVHRHLAQLEAPRIRRGHINLATRHRLLLLANRKW